VGERLNWIPGRVFMCFTFKEADLRLRVVQLLDTIMLHKYVLVRRLRLLVVRCS